jgi:hypothetical protein
VDPPVAELAASAPPALACRAITGASGVEDIEVHAETGTAFLSSTDRRAVEGQRAVRAPGGHVGHLFRLDLREEDPRPVDVTPAVLRDHVFQPHGLGLLSEGRNSARLFVVNHRGPLDPREAARKQHTIEIIDITTPDGAPPVLSLDKTVSGGLTKPNDVTPAGGRAFFVTNTDEDEGTALNLLRSALGRNRGSVAYFNEQGARGATLRLPWANGILADTARGIVHVSSAQDGLIRSFAWRGGEEPRLLATVATGGRADNLSQAGPGALLATTHPSLYRLLRHAISETATAPTVALRVPLDAATGMPTTPLGLLLRNDGDERRPDGLAAGSVAAVWRRAAGAPARYLLGAILSDRVLLCDEQPAPVAAR